MSRERRQHPRVDLVAQVEVASSDLVHLLRATNASRGGLFLEANPDNYPQFEVGGELQVHVGEVEEHAADSDTADGDAASDEDIAISGRARIVRIERNAAATRGFAIQFLDLDAENTKRLENLLARGTPSET